MAEPARSSERFHLVDPDDYAALVPESMAHMSAPELKARVARGPLFGLTIRRILRARAVGNWIWYTRAFRYSVRTTIDGLVYGFPTGGAYGRLWPSL